MKTETQAANAYGDESHLASSIYDIIIGRDSNHSLEINILFDTAKISWDNARVKMQPPEWVNGAWIDHLEQELLHAHDPTTTDAERTPADLKTIAKECTHLPKDEQRQLLKIRQKFESLFDGTLGVWKTAPVDLELKDPHVKPYHAKPYPVPYSQEKKLKEEIKDRAHTVYYRRFKTQVCPMFAIAKPDVSLRSFAD